jgi:hypothetical protein
MTLSRKNANLAQTINVNSNAIGDTILIPSGNIVNLSGIFTATSGDFTFLSVPKIEFPSSGNVSIIIEALDDNSLNFKSSLNSSILRIYPSGTVSVTNSGSLLVSNNRVLDNLDIVDGGNC